MISIIIPVFNEEAAIERTLKSLPYGKDLEVIIVDGQSNDRTMDIVGQYPVKVITSSRGRAVQMNAGAAVARGDVFLFLHADCVIAAEGLRVIAQHILSNCVGGCFTHQIDSEKWIYRWIETSGNVRAKLFKIFYGDQAMFVRRDIFEHMGGFDQVPLFEDVLFSRQLRQLGKTIVLDSSATVLPRRWEKRGIIRTTLINILLSWGFTLGVSTQRLAKLYKNVR